MSEKKPTIEERYEDIGTVLTAYLEDAQSASIKACLVWGSDLADIGNLLVDLMAERGKMKEKIYALEKFIDIISKEPVHE